MVPCTALHLHSRAPCALPAPHRGSPIRALRRLSRMGCLAPPPPSAPRGAPIPRAAAPLREWCIWTWRLTSSRAHRGSPIHALRRLYRMWCLAPPLHLAALPACGALHHPCPSRLSYSAYRGAYPRVVLYTPAPVPLHRVGMGSRVTRLCTLAPALCSTQLAPALASGSGLKRHSPVHACACVPHVFAACPRLSRMWYPAPPLHLAALLFRTPRRLSASGAVHACACALHMM
jgi:hypothetical protein